MASLWLRDAAKKSAGSRESDPSGAPLFRDAEHAYLARAVDHRPVTVSTGSESSIGGRDDRVHWRLAGARGLGEALCGFDLSCQTANALYHALCEKFRGQGLAVLV